MVASIDDDKVYIITGDVVQRIEKSIDEAKQLMQEMRVFNFEEAA